MDKWEEQNEKDLIKIKKNHNIEMFLVYFSLILAIVLLVFCILVLFVPVIIPLMLITLFMVLK